MTIPKKRQDLNKLYNEFNKQFFRGRLPAYRVRLANFHGMQRGLCSSKKRTIYLKRGLDLEHLRRTLLHEMCHIGAPTHGKKWKAKMARLADLGETWARDELAKSTTWNQEMRELRASLDALAYERPRPSFRSVIRSLSKYYSFTYREFNKRVPWLRAAWQNSCRETDREKALKEKWDKLALAHPRNEK